MSGLMNHWDNRFMSLAEHVATWSRDPSTKVGCVLVNRDTNNVVAMGYNGFPRHVSDDPERYNDRAVKYLMIQHAEMNAIFNATGPIKGSIAYVTHQPCAQCTGALIQSGISVIVTRPTEEGLKERFKDSFQASEIMLNEAGINTYIIKNTT